MKKPSLFGKHATERLHERFNEKTHGTILAEFYDFFKSNKNYWPVPYKKGTVRNDEILSFTTFKVVISWVYGSNKKGEFLRPMVKTIMVKE